MKEAKGSSGVYLFLHRRAIYPSLLEQRESGCYQYANAITIHSSTMQTPPPRAFS